MCLACAKCKSTIINVGHQETERTQDLLCGPCVRDIQRELSAMRDEFRKLSNTPPSDPVTGLLISRMHFGDWADRLQGVCPKLSKRKEENANKRRRSPRTSHVP